MQNICDLTLCQTRLILRLQDHTSSWSSANKTNWIMQRTYKKCLQSTEMDLEECLQEDPQLENVSEESENSDRAVVSSLTSVTLENERRCFDKEDKSFWDIFNTISVELSDIYESNSEEQYLEFVNSSSNKKRAAVCDYLGGSLLYVAVEQGNECLTKCLLDMGLDVNCREGCGVTPLSIAVLCQNTTLCKFLVESGARCKGPLFTSIPLPICMAHKLDLADILKLFDADEELLEEENELIGKIDRDSTTSSVYVTTELYEKRVHAYLGNCACVLAGHKQREFSSE